MPSLPTAIPDTALGLSQSELHILRQHQQIALSAQPTPTHSHNPSLASTRGRGTARVSNSSSRAASNASSHVGGGGRMMLDAGSLQALGAHFERLMSAIQRKVDSLNAQTSASISAQTSRTATSIAQADKEIARMKDIIRMIDDLENEYDKVRHIRDIMGVVEGGDDSKDVTTPSPSAPPPDMTKIHSLNICAEGYIRSHIARNSLHDAKTGRVPETNGPQKQVSRPRTSTTQYHTQTQERIE
ncbi:uncharacterized protein KY384_006391 [Bacidia gigantensis]|uniref:uncharacterized protein n=1 Tax=Bacidia gigantensis TaxID=2732470 RepID=UPI001D0540B6|nr:uncharacterized protein KY384_006391 [Bacidia gigantensis]KAG8528704.1 hypothetical protein KY384_006391 [Bacidia gigantensis]